MNMKNELTVEGQLEAVGTALSQQAGALNELNAKIDSVASATAADREMFSSPEGIAHLRAMFAPMAAPAAIAPVAAPVGTPVATEVLTVSDLKALAGLQAASEVYSLSVKKSTLMTAGKITLGVVVAGAVGAGVYFAIDAYNNGGEV